jgi:hypothetical protein
VTVSLNLSESEKVAKIERFGFDKPPSMLEIAERMSVRAADIAQLSASLVSDLAAMETGALS